MPKTAPIAMTKEEMDALLDATMENDFYYTLFSLARRTGRRLGEYYQVKVSDCQFDKNIMITRVLKRRAYKEKEAILDNADLPLYAVPTTSTS